MTFQAWCSRFQVGTAGSRCGTVGPRCGTAGPRCGTASSRHAAPGKERGASGSDCLCTFDSDTEYSVQNQHDDVLHVVNVSKGGPTLADIMNEMRDMRAELVQKVDNACGDIKKVKEDCSKLRRDVEQHDNTNLKRQLDSVEGQARRNNVVIRGIPGRRGETWEECEKLVRQSMVDDLQIDAEEVEKINIERAHRLPQRRGRDRNESRDNFAKFAFFKDKGKVMEKAKTLKPKGLFYMQDFTQRVNKQEPSWKTNYWL